MPEGGPVSDVAPVQADPKEGSPYGKGSPTVTVPSLSYSRLSKYASCGVAFKLQYIDLVPTETSGAGLAGTATHLTTQAMVDEGWYAKADIVETHGAEMAVDKFEELVEAEGGPDKLRWGGYKRILRDEDTGKPILDAEGNQMKVGENYDWMRKTIPTWVKRAGGILRRDKGNGLVVVSSTTEMSVSRFLTEKEDVLITGFIDVMMVQDQENGKYRIRDWKTGTWIEPMQLANYAWLVEGMGWEVDTGEIAYLRGAKPEDWVRVYDVSKWKAIVPMMYESAVKGIEAEHYQLHPSSFCTSCWVRTSCPYGKTLEA